MILLAAPVITQPRVMGVLTRRAASLRNVQEDNSYQNRIMSTRYAISQMTKNPAGSGLGSYGGAGKLISGSKQAFALDNGPLEVFGIMGWIGGALYMLALVAIVLPIVRGRKILFETFTSAAVSTVIALLATSLFGNVFNGVSGFFFWSAVGIATAGRTYAAASEITQRYRDHPGLPDRSGPVSGGHQPFAA